MRAPMTMATRRTRTMKVALLIVVMVMFAPSFGRAETSVVHAAKSGRQAANVHAVAVPHVTTDSVRATDVRFASGNGAARSTVGRRAPASAAIGGAAKYDAKHGGVIGGAVMGRKR